MASAFARHLAVRITAAALAVAMLVAPSVAQLTAAEICASRCAVLNDSTPACCAKHAAASDHGGRAGNPDPAHQQSPGNSDQMCPGCNGRPLIASTDRLDLSLHPTALVLPTLDPSTAISAGVPFAIFHPPRA